MRIGIIGSGIVGLATGLGLSRLGNDVTFFDIDIKKIKDLKIQGLKATSDIDFLTKSSDIFFLCVPTPDKNRNIDLGIATSAIIELSKSCRKKDKYFIIVIKSTVVPMSTEKILIPLIIEYTKKDIGNDFGVCFNPEFLRDENAQEDFMNPDRIVIGEYDKKSGDILAELYSHFNSPIIRTDLITAEMAKYANNCFYATKISFFNEIHEMCKKIGIDSNIIRRIVQTDKFYGTHPWKHGYSFGGKCLPKDLNAIISLFNEGHIHNPILLKAVRDVNENMKEKEKSKNKDFKN